jgi:hypothetical protein
MKRHIIIEGCDGTGKDTLIERLLMTNFGRQFQVHQRASTSLGGPVASLDEWVEEDTLTLAHTGPWIYNRHPLISETIYAPYREMNRGLSGQFKNPTWITEHRRYLAQYSVLVILKPPFSRVKQIVESQGVNAHLPGVYTHLESIYNTYATFLWPGTTIRYDRTKNNHTDLFRTIATALGKE